MQIKLYKVVEWRLVIEASYLGVHVNLRSYVALHIMLSGLVCRRGQRSADNMQIAAGAKLPANESSRLPLRLT